MKLYTKVYEHWAVTGQKISKQQPACMCIPTKRDHHVGSRHIAYLLLCCVKRVRSMLCTFTLCVRPIYQPDSIHTYSLLLQKDNNNDTSSKWMSKLSANSPIILRAYSSLLHSATAGHTFVLSVSNTSVNTADDRPAWMPWLEWLQCICAIMQ